MSELRLVSQLVKLVEQTAKQKALIDFQLAMLNKEKDTLRLKDGLLMYQLK